MKLLRFATVLALAVAATASARAQALFTLEVHDTVGTIVAGGSLDFHVTVRNTGSSDVTFYVERTINDAPDGWSSSVCTNELCYPPTRDKTDATTLPGNGTVDVKLTVNAGTTADESGHFELAFSTDFGFPQAVDFHATSAVSGVTLGSGALVAAAAYPNPASTHLTIPLATQSRPSLTRVAIFDARGNRVALDDAQLRVASTSISVDVSTLPAGSYFFRVEDGDRRDAGSFVVTR